MSNQEELKTEIENIRDSIQALKQEYEQTVTRIQRALDRSKGDNSSLINYAKGEQRSLERVIRDFEELLK